MTRKIIIMALLLTYYCTQTSLAQELEQREFVFLQKNIDLYREGRYKKAEQNFSLVISRLPHSRYLTTNHLMLAKSKYKLENFSGSINVCKEFLIKFPKSDYRDDILFTMGNSYYKLNRFETAIKTWVKAFSVSNDERLIKKIGFL